MLNRKQKLDTKKLNPGLNQVQLNLGQHCHNVESQLVQLQYSNKHYNTKDKRHLGDELGVVVLLELLP
jgi:hypothetical protein